MPRSRFAIAVDQTYKEAGDFVIYLGDETYAPRILKEMIKLLPRECLCGEAFFLNAAERLKITSFGSSYVDGQSTTDYSS